MKSILVVECDPEESSSLAAMLSGDYLVQIAADRESATRSLKSSTFDIIMLGKLPPPKLSSRMLLENSLGDATEPCIIVIRGNDVSGEMTQSEAGISWFLEKPYSMLSLRKTIRDACLYHSEKQRKSPVADRNIGYSSILGDSPLIRDVRISIKLFARFDFPVLIRGESGTGKELAAHEIHSRSRRHEGPFVALNCGAIPANLAESELFGTERGAFTGAVSRAGSWERASGGTLFLDEIGELPEEVQVKLLRTMENGEIVRLGSTQTMHADVRIIAATNVELMGTESKKFRYDLLCRLETLTLEIPPLRMRKSDIRLLALHFSQILCASKSIDERGLSALEAYDWPGNVRQLKNSVCRASVLADEDECISMHHISFGSRPRSG